MRQVIKSLAIGLMFCSAPMAWAQTDTTDTAAQSSTSEADTAALLTQAELENLVAPIALYPDTLLIQVLVAATYPLEIVMADRFATDNAEMDPDALSAAIEAQEYDESVAVLATAFPDVLSDMAAHVEWTDSIGTAMLAQSDDVLNAVQTMRTQAINAGALISGAAQTVSVEDDEVIIQPADPAVVYVPQYNPQTVYVEKDNNVLGNALITFTVFALINEIFSNDNHWHNYWGCRNCAGWGGKPIYRNPRVNIGIGGNVNIANSVTIGGGRDHDRNGAWKPEPKRQKDARAKISNKRGPGGQTKMQIDRPNSRGDAMRTQLSSKTGVADISGSRGNRPSTRPNVNRPGTSQRDAIARTGQKPSRASAPVNRPAAKPATRKPVARAPAARKPSAMAKRAPSHKSRAASSRGKTSGSRHRGRR